MKLLVKKSFNKLVPVFNSDAEKLKEAKLKEGVVYEIEIVKKRNYEFHKKYFSLINLCFDNQDVFDDFDNCRDYLTCKAGFYTKITTPDGEMIKPKSIKFSKMDDVEFGILYQKTIDTICKFIDVEEKELLSEIVEYL